LALATEVLCSNLLSEDSSSGGGQFVFAVGGQALLGLDELFFLPTEVVNQEFCAVGPAEKVETLQVRLPIAYVLIV
jgi:hypothetical protein